ncbi:MAG: hypothetical protein ACI9EW_001346 [Cellvibrionaceae bacterium]|jgi:hypothetical protein
MQLLAPQNLPYDYDEWRQQPFHIRAKMVCQAWAIQGYGAPPAVYGFYILKVVFYIWMWSWFAGFSSDLGNLSSIATWWFKPEALAKAIAWSILFEGLGLASGSGPLTARYNPPFGGFLYFLRPKTIKIPFIPGLPFFGGDTRRWVDSLLYFIYIVLLVRLLISSAVTPVLIWPPAILLLVLGLSDRTQYLASRPEHYLIAIVCFAFPESAIPAAKWVWFGVWIWAATSKLNHHFPSVISVMVSNSAVIRSEWVRKLLFRDFPNDLRASSLATKAAHIGTATEYTFPLLLMFGAFWGGSVWGWGSPAVVIGLVVMVGFHTFITSNIPMGVPIEWNFMMVYGGIALFGAHADISPFTVQSFGLAVLLIIALFIVPLAGNLFPASVSFLVGMRFYAGNWAYSVWLFKDDAEEKINSHVTTTAATIPAQISMLYDQSTSEALLSRVIAFRMMHLHGRALHSLLPKAVDDIDRYVWRDGELVAGVVLGWNFGDGHLHNELLLESLQKRCQWESGDLRVIFVDPQPIGRPFHDWRIFDAKDGKMSEGRITVDELRSRQPYPSEEDMANFD